MSALPQRPDLDRGATRPEHMHDGIPLHYAPLIMESRPGYTAYPDTHPHPFGQEAIPPPHQPRQSAVRQEDDAGSAGDTTPERPARKRQRAPGREPGSPTSAGKVKAENGVPAVLIREKKQKACANCRRAKLKCIVEDGEADCIRCKSRTEKCVFYPRTHDDDLQQILTQDIYTAISHLSDLSSAVHHILFHLTQNSVIPPFIGRDRRPLERYEAPDRDMPAMYGWSAEQNQDLKPSVDKRKKRARDADGPKHEDRGHSSRVRSDYEAARQRSHPAMNDGQRNSAPGQMPFDDDHYPAMAIYPPHIPSVPPPLQDSLAGFTILPPLAAQQSHPSLADPHRAALSQRSRLDALSDPSPTTLQEITPRSAVRSSPLLSQSPQKSIDQRPVTVSSTEERQSGLLPASMDMEDVVLVPEGCSPGMDDMRADVISEKKVTVPDAQVMINYSHRNLSPFLFGYHLGLGRFPYLPEGATTMTPLILGVLCMLAAERLPDLFKKHVDIAESVKLALATSPARSWQNLGPEANATDSDDLDPELGIGPEEIVATAMLSLWQPDTDDAPSYAAAAFKWARGWIRILSDEFPRIETIAEITNTVVELRKATPADMARVWLLCYIADGLVAIMAETPPEITHEPTAYCLHLVPNLFTSSSFDGADPHDIILTSHARLISIFREWEIKSRSFSFDVNPDRGNTLQRLTINTDYQITNLRDSIQGFVPSSWTSVKELNLFALFAKTTIYSKLAAAVTSPARQRAASVAQTVDIGLEGLEACASWTNPGQLANLPRRYITMIYLIAHTVVQAVTDAANSPVPTGCSVTPSEVYPLLEQISQSLQHTDLREQHKVPQCAACLEKMAEQLRKLSGL